MTKIFLSEELRLMLQRDYLKKEDKWVVLFKRGVSTMYYGKKAFLSFF